MYKLTQTIFSPFMTNVGKLLHKGFIDYDYNTPHGLYHMTSEWLDGPANFADKAVLRMDMTEDKRRAMAEIILKASVNGFVPEEPEAPSTGQSALSSLAQIIQGATGATYATSEDKDDQA